LGDVVFKNANVICAKRGYEMVFLVDRGEQRVNQIRLHAYYFSLTLG
jgi:hypothetical protein